MQAWQELVRSGNAHFAAREFVAARRCYQAALASARKGVEALLDHDPLADPQLAACVVCALNLADAQIELGDPNAAVAALLGVEGLLAGLLGRQPIVQVTAPVVLRHLNRLRLERMVLLRSPGRPAAVAGRSHPRAGGAPCAVLH